MMMRKSKVSFCTSNKSDEEAKEAADMWLENDEISDVVNAVVRGRAFKDRLMQFLLLQISASISSVAMVFIQVFMFREMIVTGSYIFLVNLVYFPITIACLVREDPGSRRYEMIERWKSVKYPGTKSVTSYMRSELLKLSILIVIVYQICALIGLYKYAAKLFTLINIEVAWEKDESLFVT